MNQEKQDNAPIIIAAHEVEGVLLGADGWGSKHQIVISEIKLCESWIKEQAHPRKTLNPRVSSYGLKHKVEDHYNHYISNGAFIRAAVNLGYRYKIHSGGLNCNFNMSFVQKNK